MLFEEGGQVAQYRLFSKQGRLRIFIQPHHTPLRVEQRNPEPLRSQFKAQDRFGSLSGR
jgi:hypothetical protein